MIVKIITQQDNPNDPNHVEWIECQGAAYRPKGGRQEDAPDYMLHIVRDNEDSQIMHIGRENTSVYFMENGVTVDSLKMSSSKNEEL